MKDITCPRLIYAKAIGFVLAGLLAAVALLLESPTPRTTALIAIIAWCAARAYYFAFYAIERYVDPRYRFSGLGSLARYLLRERRTKRPSGAARSGQSKSSGIASRSR
jgi:hypothetical protein